MVEIQGRQVVPCTAQRDIVVNHVLCSKLSMYMLTNTHRALTYVEYRKSTCISTRRAPDLASTRNTWFPMYSRTLPYRPFSRCLPQTKTQVLTSSLQRSYKPYDFSIRIIRPGALSISRNHDGTANYNESSMKCGQAST